MSGEGAPVTPPKPPARRGRAILLVIAIAAIAGAYLWANQPAPDQSQSGPYEPAPPAPAPAEDSYTASEVAPFSIAINEVPMEPNRRWSYSTSFGQTITIDYILPEDGAETSYRLGLRQIDNNLLYTMFVFQETDRIVERLDAPAGPVSMVYEFPLEVGKSWSFPVQGSDDAGQPTEVNYTVTVEAAEEITVPFGTFPCLRLRNVAEGSDNPGTVLWFAANVGTVRIRTADGGVAQLESYGPIPLSGDAN